MASTSGTGSRFLNSTFTHQVRDVFEELQHARLLCAFQVGGIGVNLTGADRVLVYDPDWRAADHWRTCCVWL